ncbi:MAG: hypothetical protein JW900_10790 [Anaerolineae bacterium]|nr:hypothetical protein [Anaerolineae bacterium]
METNSPPACGTQGWERIWAAEEELDLGCGVGRHTLPLVQSGFQVLGTEEKIQCCDESEVESLLSNFDLDALGEVRNEYFDSPGVQHRSLHDHVQARKI